MINMLNPLKFAAGLFRPAAVCCAAVATVLGVSSCQKKADYGMEYSHMLPAEERQVWAVAPALNLSGQPSVDALLQADLLFAEMQNIRGLRAIPVNRVAQVYAALGITQVESADMASRICEMLGCDALVVPTVTLFDPYDPPKMGAALQVFVRNGVSLRPGEVFDANQVQVWQRSGRDPGGLAMAEAPTDAGAFLQEAAVFDASHGSTRRSALYYATGRSDPKGAASSDEVFLSMDRYAGFVYHELLGDVMYHIDQQNRQIARQRRELASR